MHATIDEILHFWLGELDEKGLCPPDRQALWFKKSAETDATLRQRFSRLHRQALAGELEDWAQSDRGLIALVILLDQFTRNLHRDTGDAFAGDPQALSLAVTALANQRHLQMPASHRLFLYMPLEHSENLALQERCVELFQELVAIAGKDAEGFLRYAQAHRDVIERFGRFPHRNNLLGRTSTVEELEYLETHGGF